MEFVTLSSGWPASLGGTPLVQHQFKESGQGRPYLGVPTCSLLRRSTFQHPLPGRRQRTTILASNARLCIKGSMRPSPPLARGCVNQHHETLAAALGLSLPDHINPLMAALIACKPTGSIIQHETECHMVASCTWFATRTLPAKDNLFDGMQPHYLSCPMIILKS